MRSAVHLRLQVNGLVMITKDEINWLAENFPHLTINETEDVIEGVLNYTSVYDKEANSFTAFLNPDIVYSGVVLSGEYRIKIIKNKKERRAPKLHVYTDESKWIPKRHFFDTGDGRACFAGPAEEDNLFARGYCFLEYFERFVIPFLYAQSYFDEYRKWPWFAYDHNAAGILQSFKNSDGTKSQVLACLTRLKASKQWTTIEYVLRGHFDGKKCLCGSGQMMNKCHTNLIFVARDFYKAVESHGLSL